MRVYARIPLLQILVMVWIVMGVTLSAMVLATITSAITDADVIRVDDFPVAVLKDSQEVRI